MPKFICTECGYEFEEEQTRYSPICPECGEVTEAAD